MEPNDWLTLVASLRDFLLVAGGASITFLGTMFTLREQRKGLDAQLRAQRQSQLREKQLHSIGEVSAVLQLAFKEADETLIEGAFGVVADNKPQVANNERNQEARLLARHKVLLPKHLEALASASYSASRAYGTSFLNFAIDEELATRVQRQPDQRFALVVQLRHDASNDSTVGANRQMAAEALEAFQSAASAFANDAATR